MNIKKDKTQEKPAAGPAKYKYRKYRCEKCGAVIETDESESRCPGCNGKLQGE